MKWIGECLLGKTGTVLLLAYFVVMWVTDTTISRGNAGFTLKNDPVSYNWFLWYVALLALTSFTAAVFNAVLKRKSAELKGNSRVKTELLIESYFWLLLSLLFILIFGYLYLTEGYLLKSPERVIYLTLTQELSFLLPILCIGIIQAMYGIIQLKLANSWGR